MNNYLKILLFFFIIIIIIIIIWIIILKIPPNNNNIPDITYMKSTYGQRCSMDNVEVNNINIPSQFIPQHCDIGLICINYGNTNICKTKIGYECLSKYECEPSASNCNVVCL